MIPIVTDPVGASLQQQLNDLINKINLVMSGVMLTANMPVIPTNLSQLNNDVGYLTTANIIKEYNAAALRTNPVEETFSAAVTNGTAVFQLTDNGLSSGNALFPNNVDFMKAEISDATSSYNYAYALTNSNKTVTITANKLVISLGLLSVNAAATGTILNLLVKGN